MIYVSSCPASSFFRDRALRHRSHYAILKMLKSGLCYAGVEGSHSGLVRAPAKRFPWETGDEGSNPSPSAALRSASAGEPAQAKSNNEYFIPTGLFFGDRILCQSTISGPSAA